jgi:3-oxoadipate enol-lactonase
MPDIKTDGGCTIHVEVEGPQSGPVLMLSNSLGTNLHMWDESMPRRKPRAAVGSFYVPER